MAARDIREIGRDIASRDGDFSVLHILWMNEGNLVDQINFLQENAAYQAVEIAAGHQTELRLCHGFLPECLEAPERSRKY
jgi:hypothetical protein